MIFVERIILFFIVIIIAISALNEAKAGSLMFELGAGANTNLTGASIPWDNAGELGCTIALRYEFKRGVCQWMHISQCLAGKPFNNLNESSVDHLGCALRWKLF